MERAESAGLLCPACRVDLMMSARQNIEIDYCPKCRGVWLDRGELDKIIERSAAEVRAASQTDPSPSSAPPAGLTNASGPWGGTGEAPASPDAYRQGGYGSHGGHGHGRDGHGRHGRGFLGRLFD